MEQPRRGELRFDALVAQDRVTAAHVEHVVRTHVMRIAGAEREATAVIRALEERMPARHAIDEDVLGSIEQHFSLAGYVRMKGIDLLDLSLFESRFARRGLKLLRRDRPRGAARHGGHDDEPRPQSKPMHCSPISKLRS